MLNFILFPNYTAAVWHTNTQPVSLHHLCCHMKSGVVIQYNNGLGSMFLDVGPLLGEQPSLDQGLPDGRGNVGGGLRGGVALIPALSGPKFHSNSEYLIRACNSCVHMLMAL